MGLVSKVFGTKNERELRSYWPQVEKINSLESQIKPLSDDALKAKTAEFKERIEKGESLESIKHEAFAVVREAAIRVLGMRHFDVQLLGGMVLHDGRIAEMKTGEGKTLTSTLPAYLNGLTGKGVHVVTVNDYLASRDSEWMGTVFSYLGLSTACVVNGVGTVDRRAAYASDITYGQNNEFGFDYLRDNMKLELEERVQRSHNFAIVDEVDSILIDESRTPLIISGPTNKATELYLEADKIVRKLKADAHFEIELKSKQTMLTDEGVQRVEEILGIDNLYDPEHIELVHHVTQSLKGHSTMKRDIDYVVRDGQIVIVDEFTGRMMTGRRWSDGLHQAVEAKEGVAIRQENQTLATITFQNYFRMYERLSGMTGTADTEAVEFGKIYGLSVTVIPTNEPLARKDHADIVYPTEAGKYRAVCREIAELHEKGQPILVGTASISHSEMVSGMLNEQGIQHSVLNAKQHEQEAEIVAQAGRMGAVTISTNMAGRGTDIVLGGNPEFLLADEAEGLDEDSAEYKQIQKELEEEAAAEKIKVLEAGGLHILGTERHESRRIDNQLRGRAGRQGDPGSSRFYVSLEDDLMKRFGGERMQALMTRMGLQEDDAIEGGLVARAIENAQKKVEGHHFDIRKHLLEYDDVLNKQREVVYSLRQRIMHNEGLEENIDEMISDVIEDVILTHAPEKEPPLNWNVEAMFLEFQRTFGIEIDATDILARQESATKELAQELFDDFGERARTKLAERKAHVGDENISKLIHIVYLQSIDHFWKEHLSNMDHLKEGIGLRGYGQKNPLHEYQRESYELFTSMMVAVKGNVLQNVFLVELLSAEQLEELERKEREALKAQEEAAKTVHQDVLAPEEAKEQKAKSGNRKQRRNQSKKKKSSRR